MNWLAKVKAWINTGKKDFAALWAKETGWMHVDWNAAEVKYHSEMAAELVALEKRLTDIENFIKSVVVPPLPPTK